MLVDTSGLLCLIHRREPQHQRAVFLYDAATTRVTHNYVPGEFVSLAQARHPRIKWL
jgi:predicted nucleic acid-binding protein